MSILERIINALLALIGGKKSPEARDAELDKKAAVAPEKLDWRNSIVDLMKLTGQDSSLTARKRLAKELGYPGPVDGSAKMNLWLKDRVMERLRSR